MNEEEQLNEIEQISEEEQIKDEVQIKKIYMPIQKLLVPIVFIIALLYDRLVVTSILRMDGSVFFFSAIFWIVYIVAFYGYNWKKLHSNSFLWIIVGFVYALCIWNFIFDYRSSYGLITWLIIPGILMVHAQYIVSDFTLKQVGLVVREWVLGWFIKPFSAIIIFIEVIQSLDTTRKNSTIRKIFTGILITLPLLLIILPLLSGADMVFGYYLKNLLMKFDFGSFFSHAIIICVATILLFSFFWNIRFTPAKEKKSNKNVDLDIMISCIVLGIIVSIYVLFCVIQFSYLFAGAGLPNGLTYSEYAREGFWQLIVIAGINLSIFGILLQYTKKNKIITIMLSCLLGLTTFMLISSFVRLGLYIDTFGMTWLRLISAWFIIYLAAVLVLCMVRLVKEKLPLMAVCGIMLLGWYTILGYANPDGLIVKYNLESGGQHWIEEDEDYICSLSDNATIALLRYGERSNVMEGIIKYKETTAETGYSTSSFRLRSLIKAYLISP